MRHSLILFACAGLLSLSACATTYRTTLKINPADFPWDGTLRVTHQYHGVFDGWEVVHVELAAADDRVLAIETDDSRGTVSPHLIGDPDAHPEVANVRIMTSSNAWFSPIQTREIQLLPVPRCQLSPQVDDSPLTPREPRHSASPPPREQSRDVAR